MYLNEHFLSIQGEGAFMGRLAIFLRFNGCNLRCVGFGVKKLAPNGQILTGCDTIKAAQSEHFSPGLKASKDDLINIVKNYNAPNAMIVLSGGEPLLYHANADFLGFIEFMLAQGKIIQIETNGTIFVDFEKFQVLKNCYFSVSVKLANSAESKPKRINARALSALFNNAKCFYKFVISGDESEIGEINEILNLQKGEVWAMSLGAKASELEKRAIKVVNLCLKNGFNYSDRLHIRLWDDKEGV